jgi:hypothetical protein
MPGPAAPGSNRLPGNGRPLRGGSPGEATARPLTSRPSKGSGMGSAPRSLSGTESGGDEGAEGGSCALMCPALMATIQAAAQIAIPIPIRAHRSRVDSAMVMPLPGVPVPWTIVRSHPLRIGSLSFDISPVDYVLITDDPTGDRITSKTPTAGFRSPHRDV